jgi:hypothetical protein
MLCDNFLTVREKRKLPGVISFWKSERKLWLKFQLNWIIFLFLSLKSVIINFSFLNLFLDIWIRNPDPDSEFGSGSRIQAQIECRSNRVRIRIRNTDINTVLNNIQWFKYVGLQMQKPLLGLLAWVHGGELPSTQSHAASQLPLLAWCWPHLSLPIFEPSPLINYTLSTPHTYAIQFCRQAKDDMGTAELFLVWYMYFMKFLTKLVKFCPEKQILWKKHDFLPRIRKFCRIKNTCKSIIHFGNNNKISF